ncbi:MAG: methionine--tRNA ligase, partial [Anaerolineae bacterium]
QYIDEVEAEGQHYSVLRYDAAPACGTWAFETLPAGRALSKPSPLFKKLDDAVIEEELARLGIQA